MKKVHLILQRKSSQKIANLIIAILSTILFFVFVFILFISDWSEFTDLLAVDITITTFLFTMSVITFKNGINIPPLKKYASDIYIENEKCTITYKAEKPIKQKDTFYLKDIGLINLDIISTSFKNHRGSDAYKCDTRFTIFLNNTNRQEIIFTTVNLSGILNNSHLRTLRFIEIFSEYSKINFNCSGNNSVVEKDIQNFYDTWKRIDTVSEDNKYLFQAVIIIILAILVFAIIFLTQIIRLFIIFN